MQTKSRSDKVACAVFRSPFIYFISRHTCRHDVAFDNIKVSLQQSHEIEVVKSKEELKTANNDSID